MNANNVLNPNKHNDPNKHDEYNEHDEHNEHNEHNRHTTTFMFDRDLNLDPIEKQKRVYSSFMNIEGHNEINKLTNDFLYVSRTKLNQSEIRHIFSMNPLKYQTIINNKGQTEIFKSNDTFSLKNDIKMR